MSRKDRVDQIIEDHRCCLDRLMKEYGVKTEAGLRRKLMRDLE